MLINSTEYLNIVETIKQEIHTAQYHASVSVNRELLMLYHSIGEIINEHKTWGSKFIENLSADIRLSFPEASGYSVRNLKYMAKFAATYPGAGFVQQPVAQIPWGHNIVLLDKLSQNEERFWYAQKTAENGWSRNVLIHQIEGGLYQRQALAAPEPPLLCRDRTKNRRVQAGICRSAQFLSFCCGWSFEAQAR